MDGVRSIRMYGMTVQMIDVQECVHPGDDPEIGSKPVVGKNKTLVVVGNCADGIIKIICIKLNRMLKAKVIYV
jgi:hypothetical protein